MQFKMMLFLFVLMVGRAQAAQLDDVRILQVTSGKDSVELRLRYKGAPRDSYFLVEIPKSDPESFAKMVLVARKLADGDGFKLSLDIPSFSPSPSGSSYRSLDVRFSGSPAKEK